jgi:diguanylate cyclase (GGDEF)-like protein
VAAIVLVADADPFELNQLNELCGMLGYEVMTAADGSAVLDVMARDRPDLVVMDGGLPGTSALSVLEVLKADPALRAIPVILAMAADDHALRRSALEVGATDYVTKPYRAIELHERMRNALRLRAARESGRPSPWDDTRRPSTDPESGVGTPEQFHVTLDYEFTRSVRYGHPISCVAVRCANQRELAERGGSEATKAVLVALGVALRTCVRGVDYVFRTGPLDFAVVLPETPSDGCKTVVERIHERVHDPSLSSMGVEPTPRLAVGAATHPDRELPTGEALWRAALANAK